MVTDFATPPAAFPVNLHFMSLAFVILSSVFLVVSTLALIAWTAFVLFSARGEKLFPTPRRQHFAVWSAAAIYGVESVAIMAAYFLA